MGLIVAGVAIPWFILSLFVALGAWLGFQLIHQNGRLLSRLESLELRFAQWPVSPISPSFPTAPLPAPPPQPMPAYPAGLPLGSPAPAFELPDLQGGRQSLASYRDQELLLIFFNPRCGFCTQMAADLAALPIDGAGGAPIPLVVSTGDLKENRQLVQEYGLRCPVLLQTGMEVASPYQAHGTPMGCLIDAQGNIASELAAGSTALLALLNNPDAGTNGHHGHQPLAANGSGPTALGGTRSLAESKIQRNGLPAGTPAPSFTLPRLGGGELSLEEFHGRKLLLVFSDPNCGPCDALTPHLEQAYRRSDDLQVLMISRGDEDANRAKAEQHGLTFPIGLQRQWEVSREYAMFATPVGYLIDEKGIISADAAAGMEPILALLSGASRVRCPCGKNGAECGCGRRDVRSTSAGRNGSAR